MFSEGVVSKRTKESVDEQRANSKFGGIYSKRRQMTNKQEKPARLREAELKLDSLPHFQQILML